MTPSVCILSISVYERHSEYCLRKYPVNLLVNWVKTSYLFKKVFSYKFNPRLSTCPSTSVLTPPSILQDLFPLKYKFFGLPFSFSKNPFYVH